MNTGEKVSEFITSTKAMNLADAVEHAYHLGFPLNRTITIHLDKAGVSSDPQAFVTEYLKRVGQWLRTKGVKPYHIWVLENPPMAGLNLHIMIHIPNEERADFNNRVRNWLRVSGGKYKSNVISQSQLQSRFQQAKFTCYMLKGADPAFFDSRALPGFFHSPQGTIKGKRCGWSESLGEAARNRSPFFPRSRTITREFRHRDRTITWDQQIQHLVLRFLPAIFGDRRAASTARPAARKCAEAVAG